MSGSNGKIHIDLDADGLHGQWIEVANIGAKSPKQFKRLRQLPSTAEELAALPDEVVAQTAREYLSLVVVAWNVNDPDTDQPLPAPDSPNLDVDAIPGVVSARIKADVERQVAALQNLRLSSAKA